MNNSTAASSNVNRLMSGIIKRIALTLVEFSIHNTNI